MDVREKLVELLCQEYQYATYEDMADGMIANGATVQEWIPVTERLPEKDVLVLCIGAKGGVFIGYPQCVYKDEKVAFTLVPNSRHSRQAKYWMPLPQPPKGE